MGSEDSFVFFNFKVFCWCWLLAVHAGARSGVKESLCALVLVCTLSHCSLFTLHSLLYSLLYSNCFMYTGEDCVKSARPLHTLWPCIHFVESNCILLCCIALYGIALCRTCVSGMRKGCLQNTNVLFRRWASTRRKRCQPLFKQELEKWACDVCSHPLQQQHI